MRKQILFGLTVLAAATVAQATDYYVNGTTGDDANDGTTAETAVQTLDKAFDLGGGTSGNNIYLKPGTYTTNKEWGYDLQANLIGDAVTRDEVILQSAGNYRTLRMNAAGPLVTNLTIVGESTQKADKGAAIELNGGMLVDCVIRDGSVKNGRSNPEGGNLYINSDSALVLNCAIFGGKATKRGGNVYLDKGTIRNCQIYAGTCDNVGGNVFLYGGVIEGCEIYDGTAVNDGGNVRINGAGTLRDSVIRDGKITTGSEKKGVNVYMDNGLLSRCHLQGGTSENGYDSGSLCAYSGSAGVIEDCLIEGSSVGGVLLGATSRLYNTTIIANEKYGVWSWTANQTMVNSVIFENFNGSTRTEWAGNQATGSSAVFTNCATSAGSLSTTTFPSLVNIVPEDFVDFANGDYHLVTTSALLDAGASDPRGATASATDLDGNPRLSGAVDIGCYEYQKQDMVVRIESATKDRDWAPAVITFAHVSENSASPENVTYIYDFGDGTTNETVATGTIVHTYANPGVYTVTIVATNDCEEESAEMTYENYVQIASSTVYVKAGNAAAAFPYDTLETAYANLRTAVSESKDGYTLYVGEGEYTWADQLSVTKALTIVGIGTTPEAVIIRNTVAEPNTYYHRTLELNNAGASLCNVTIENGCVKNQYGGNLRVAGGASVSNCVIRGGLAVADNGNGAGAAVVLGGSYSTITHCVISNNTVQGTSNDRNYAGGAIFIEYNAKYIHMSNLLIAGNKYVPSDETKSGTAGIRFGGGNDWTTVENCTIVANTVEGSLPEDSAGLYCTTWHGLIRNNIIVGNVETGKGKCTSVMLDTSGGSNYQYRNNITDDKPITGSATKATANRLVSNGATLFKNFGAGDYTLAPQGEAYGNGTAELTLTPSVDLAGNPRSMFKSIDVGCFEAQRRPGFIICIR